MGLSNSKTAVPDHDACHNRGGGVGVVVGGGGPLPFQQGEHDRHHPVITSELTTPPPLPPPCRCTSSSSRLKGQSMAKMVPRDSSSLSSLLAQERSFSQAVSNPMHGISDSSSDLRQEHSCVCAYRGNLNQVRCSFSGGDTGNSSVCLSFQAVDSSICDQLVEEEVVSSSQMPVEGTINNNVQELNQSLQQWIKQEELFGGSSGGRERNQNAISHSMPRMNIPPPVHQQSADEGDHRNHLCDIQRHFRRYASPARGSEVEPDRTSLSTENVPRVRRRHSDQTTETQNGSALPSAFALNYNRDSFPLEPRQHELALPRREGRWGRSHSQPSRSLFSGLSEGALSSSTAVSPPRPRSNPSLSFDRGMSSGREARRNNGRRLWDALTRAASNRRVNSPRMPNDQEQISGRLPSERSDHNTNLRNRLNEGPSYPRVLRNAHIHRSRSLNLEERARRFRSQIWTLQRLGGTLEGASGHARPSSRGVRFQGSRQLHESSRVSEDTNSRANISRIIMLAEALFEVLDEIHRHSLALSRTTGFSLGSLPAPESIVESLPVRCWRLETDNLQNGQDDSTQCHICLVEYEDGDEIRLLPCNHEYHKACIDKWLKEVHRVCPLCRGDVCELLAIRGLQ